MNMTNRNNTTETFGKAGLEITQINIGAKAVINDNVNSHNLTNLRQLILKQPLMSIMDRNPPRQTANIFVLFNAFETLCFPTCITDTSRVAYIFYL